MDLDGNSVPLNLSTAKSVKQKPASPIENGIRSWLGLLPTGVHALVPPEVHKAALGAPKRWVVYTPMVLLPSGSFEQLWWQELAIQIPQHIDSLWQSILAQISKREGKGKLTHLAINAGIPLNKHEDENENVLRTPSGLLMLCGNFGPALDPGLQPTERDLEEAFWVRTKQNGIVQIWAPRYTMFSRGNIKEKSRILDFHSKGKHNRSNTQVGTETAIDLYAGIGYFVFSYVKMGMKRVLGWEINPWSVEGLRRGALANGWTAKVIRPEETLSLENENVVIFVEDNLRASERLLLVEQGAALKISHVNCGLLPSSAASWETALSALSGDGWLHLHENVGVKDIAKRKEEIGEVLHGLLTRKQSRRFLTMDEVDLVKTFAPGVWHCVFDVFITDPVA
ncbi:tRNA wybutosine-synthesizing protein-like protein [Calycina marina]|uniref:tRNA wybutosine-synthesizing protein 2 n=1 Tax=Calycina marina TaxID=1763456 RepID=A0A9P7Z2Z8_9HELO|nr:tRNA wybutosine-synthesizing protein-like protein [Calycina marina]